MKDEEIAACRKCEKAAERQRKSRERKKQRQIWEGKRDANGVPIKQVNFFFFYRCDSLHNAKPALLSLRSDALNLKHMI
jgi:hypothetical protein